MFGRVKEHFSFIRGNFAVLLMSWLVWNFTMRIANPYLSLYILALGGTSTIIGVITASSAFAEALIWIPGGYIADRWGRKRIVAIMTFIIACMYLFYIFAIDWVWVLIGSVFSSFSLIYQPALRAMVADSIPPEKRGSGYILTTLVPGIPAIFAPYLGGLLISHYGLDGGVRIAFFLVFVGGVLVAAIRGLFLTETLKGREEFAAKSLREILFETVRKFFDALRWSPTSLKGILVCASIMAISMSAAGSFYIVYASFRSITPEEWGLLLTISAAFTAFAGISMGRLIDRYGRRAVLLPLFLILSAALCGFAFFNIFSALLLMYTVISVAETAGRAALNAFEADLTPKWKRGRVLGGIDVVSALVRVPASIVAGVGYDQISPVFPFLMVSLLYLVGAFVLLLFVKEHEKREL